VADETTDTTETSTTSSTETADATATVPTADAGEADDTTLLGSATAGEGAGDGESADSKEPPTPTPAPDDSGVPEAYELKAFKVGEGDDATEVHIDSGLLETVTPGLKDAGVTQAQLDKLAPMVPAIQEATIRQMNDNFAATRADWAKQTLDDPEIGGKNLNETRLLAAKALDHFGAKSEIKEIDGKKVETNEFRKLLNESGLGEHPVMIRMFRNIGAAVSEDGTFVRNTIEPETKLSREQRLYPDDQPKA
jgi:hypothetical protein